jgi:hypothetical protein
MFVILDGNQDWKKEIVEDGVTDFGLLLLYS